MFLSSVSSYYPRNNTNQCSPEHQSTVSDLGLNVASQKWNIKRDMSLMSLIGTYCRIVKTIIYISLTHILPVPTYLEYTLFFRNCIGGYLSRWHSCIPYPFFSFKTKSILCLYINRWNWILLPIFGLKLKTNLRLYVDLQRDRRTD